MTRSRSLNNALGRLLAGSRFPVYAVDGERRLIYGNEALFEWTSTDEQLIGTRCDYHSNPEVGPAREAAARLCPPPEAFRGSHVTAEVSCRSPTGHVSRRRARFVPLSHDELDPHGVFVVVDPSDQSDSQTKIELSANPTPAELHRQLVELRRHISPNYGIDCLVGQSSAIRRVRRQMMSSHRARPHTVVVAPPGSGREHVARTIHYGDHPDLAGRLVPIACPLMDPELLQATITNVKRHQEADEHPTLLLLDVDQLPASSQHELQGFLELPRFPLHTLSTARRDLLKLSSADGFLAELAFTLSTMVIELPSLCERAEDIPFLAQAFVEQFNSEGGRQISGFSAEALDQLAAYHWPENVDELIAVVRSACQQAEESVIGAADLPERLHLAADAAAHPKRVEETIELDQFLARIEAELIQRAMQRAKGNKTKASRLLGVTRARLHRRLEQLSCNQQSEPGPSEDGVSAAGRSPRSLPDDDSGGSGMFEPREPDSRLPGSDFPVEDISADDSRQRDVSDSPSEDGASEDSAVSDSNSPESSSSDSRSDHRL